MTSIRVSADLLWREALVATISCRCTKSLAEDFFRHATYVYDTTAARDAYGDEECYDNHVFGIDVVHREVRAISPMAV